MAEVTKGEELREDLVRFVRRKFPAIDNIELASEDIVNQAYLNVLKGRGPRGREFLTNFSYMSTVCLRIAFKLVRATKSIRRDCPGETEPDSLPGEDDPLGQLLDEEAIEAIAASLYTLRAIERVIIEQRYYGEASFAEIARNTGIKLNTVLSHHRRALERLRPRLALYFEEGLESDPEAEKSSRVGTFAKFF